MAERTIAYTERIGAREAMLFAALPMLLAFGFGAGKLPGVLAGGLLNPDSYMRLLRLRETLAAGHPTYAISRDGSGAGTVYHCSHLLESLIALLAAPLQPLLGLPAALHAAAMLIGPLSLAALGVAAAWASAPFAARPWRWLAPLLVALAPSIASYGLLGVAHHHVLVVAIAAMQAGLLARVIAGRPIAAAGLRLGALAGLGLWLTPESLPLSVLGFGALWLHWLRQRDAGQRATARHLLAACLTLLLVATAAWLVDPPEAGYAATPLDRLSLPFIALAVALATSTAAIAVVAHRAPDVGHDPRGAARRDGHPPRWVRRLAVSLLAGGLSAAGWIAAFPVVLHARDAIMPAADWPVFFGAINEMQPIVGLAAVLQHLLTGILAALLLGWLAWRRRDLLLAYAAAAVLALLVAAQAHVRFAAYPTLAGAVMVPIAITRLEQHAAGWRPCWQAASRMAIVLSCILLPGIGGLVPPVGAAQAAVGRPAHDCTVSGLAPLLAPYAGRIVLADPNVSPELLYRTPVLTVGSLYQRNPAAFLRLRAAWRSMPSRAEPVAVAATGAALVLACPRAQRAILVADLPPDTLLDRLQRGDVPAWLHQVAADPASGNILYEVVR